MGIPPTPCWVFRRRGDGCIAAAHQGPCRFQDWLAARRRERDVLGTKTLTLTELDYFDAGLRPTDVGVDLDPPLFSPAEPVPQGLLVLPWCLVFDRA